MTTTSSNLIIKELRLIVEHLPSANYGNTEIYKEGTKFTETLCVLCDPLSNFVE
jgi:hypothetical protein